MGKKHLKFLSIPGALEELKNTLMMLSELKKQEEIEPLLARIQDFGIRKDVKKVRPLDFSDRYLCRTQRYLDQPEDRRTGEPLPLVKEASKKG